MELPIEFALVRDCSKLIASAHRSNHPPSFEFDFTIA